MNSLISLPWDPRKGKLVLLLWPQWDLNSLHRFKILLKRENGYEWILSTRTNVRNYYRKTKPITHFIIPSKWQGILYHFHVRDSWSWDRDSWSWISKPSGPALVILLIKLQENVHIEVNAKYIHIHIHFISLLFI